jgi:hypothetical protein
MLTRGKERNEQETAIPASAQMTMVNQDVISELTQDRCKERGEEQDGEVERPMQHGEQAAWS